jgi:hypothetical protein
LIIGLGKPPNIFGQANNDGRVTDEAVHWQQPRQTTSFANHIVPGKFHISILPGETRGLVVPAFYRFGVLQQPQNINPTVFLVAETHSVSFTINIVTALFTSTGRTQSAYVPANNPRQAATFSQQADGLGR